MMNWGLTEAGQSPIAVTVPSRSALLSDLDNRLDEGRGFSVATVNLDHVVKLKRDPVFRAAYAAHTHVTADGNPIVWLSRLAGRSDIELTPGSELIDPVAALAAKKGVPIGLFGSDTSTLAGAARALEGRHNGLAVCYQQSPAFGFDPTGKIADDAIKAISKSDAKVVFLALGAPKQEVFADRAQAALPDVGFISIGAGLDFIVGTQKRAPKFVRAIAAEWLWRMLGNPRRLAGRYASCIVILPKLTVSAIAARRQKRVEL